MNPQSEHKIKFSLAVFFTVSLGVVMYLVWIYPVTKLVTMLIVTLMASCIDTAYKNWKLIKKVESKNQSP